MCGSDAMLINGRNRLACQTLVRDLGGRITVAPLVAFRVVKDLVVDLEPFFAQYRSVMPYFVNREPPPERERLQTPEERARYEETTKCILCAACTSSCPIFWGNRAFVGPAAIVAAHRFLFDSRDRAAEERLAQLDRLGGVWSCRTIQNCTQACPRGIDVAGAILEVKRFAIRRHLVGQREETRHRQR
jgi:succinate dehydrogenase / fumarate reductase iron-sulfur subunit